MYTPLFNAVHDEAEVRAMVASARTAWLVTSSAGNAPVATLLPVMWRENIVIAHMAKANPQWEQIADDSPALLIAGGAQAYISPSWYAVKAEHGRVVPTWNYSAVHLTGTVRTHHNIEWLRRAVTDLTETHEGGRDHEWQVSDAPPGYIEGQLRGIVGIEFAVSHIEGKAKLSQNRSAPDQHGVIRGLRAETLSPTESADAEDIAEKMAELLSTHN